MELEDKKIDIVISDMRIDTCDKSNYIRPYRLRFKQNGISRVWDAFKEQESVYVLLYNSTRQCIVFVSQFRPAVYMSRVRELAGEDITSIDTTKYPASLGLTMELCAGLVDKKGSLEEIAQMEILEECGYQVPVEKLEMIMSYRTGIGLSGARQTGFYAEVTDDMRVTQGGGLVEEGEMINVIHMPIEDTRQFLEPKNDVPKPVGMMYAIQWFFMNKYKSG